MNKNKLVNGFIIGTFVSLYVLVSVVSTIHVIDFFSLSNPYWLAVTLAVGFELGAAASLAALITLEKMNKTLVWALFLAITGMQVQGNMYYAFINLEDFYGWVELFNLVEWEPLAQKRLLAAVSGAILPLVALGFIKSLVDYIKPESEDGELSTDDLDDIVSDINQKKSKLDDIEIEYDIIEVRDEPADLEKELWENQKSENPVVEIPLTKEEEDKMWTPEPIKRKRATMPDNGVSGIATPMEQLRTSKIQPDEN